MGNYIGNEKNAICGGRSKQPLALMAFVLAGCLSNRHLLMTFVLTVV
jgi:hypothetical protein